MPSLTPDEYIALLVERAREADEQSRADRAAAGLPPAPAWVRHLPEWMVRDGDEDLVDMAAASKVYGDRPGARIHIELIGGA